MHRPTIDYPFANAMHAFPSIVTHVRVPLNPPTCTPTCTHRLVNSVSNWLCMAERLKHMR